MGTKFSPKEKESTMTDAERKAAINAKRQQLTDVDTAVLLGNGIKLAVMTPLPDPENFITEKLSKDLGMKMLSIASQNGVSGMGGDPTFVLLAGITGATKKLTGTVPQKTMITYDITLYVGNIATSDVFGSATFNMVGVGNNESQAAANAAKGLKNSNEIQQMLARAEKKIVDYYNNHAAQIKADIEAKINSNDYEAAYALLRSIPQEASAIFPWVSETLPSVGQKIMLKASAENLARLKVAIAEGDEQFNPEAGAYLAMIPTNAPEYAEAQKLYSEYTERLRKQSDDKTAWERQQAERQQQIEHAENMLKIEMDAKVAQSEAKQMSSAEMRRQISLEDAAGSPFKLLWRKAGYALNDLFGGFGSSDDD